jgi:transposase-like protein
MKCPKCENKMKFHPGNIEENPHWNCDDCDFFVLTDEDGEPEGPETDAWGQVFSDASPGL